MKLPFFLSIPHCAVKIPDAMRSDLALSEREIIESADLGTGEIFGDLPAMGVFRAEWNRLVADLNRAPDDYGPKGVIPRMDYYGRTVYLPGRAPGKKERLRRLEQIYRPYHRRLDQAVAESAIWGLFDCHAMNGIGPPEAPDPGRKREDIILSNNGDPEGGENPFLGMVTCPREVLYQIRDRFRKRGFSVALNYPYTGGFITVRYGTKLRAQGKFVLQVEINQDLFMLSRTTRIDSEKLKDVKSRVLSSFRDIAAVLGKRT